LASRGACHLLQLLPYLWFSIMEPASISIYPSRLTWTACITFESSLILKPTPVSNLRPLDFNTSLYEYQLYKSNLFRHPTRDMLYFAIDGGTDGG
ncbi:hypothetical protein ACFLV4_06445, partial [Chloroflexota bacterium]